MEGFEGPLDFLLKMVRRQRVDLGPLSILTLTDQLMNAIENSGGIRPERRADWLVMASQLLLLKAQLLAPPSQAAAEEAGAEARRRLEQPDGLTRMRAGATWLAARPQLGREVFARGQGEPPAPRPRARAVRRLPRGDAHHAEGRKGQRMEPPPTYRPAPPELWRIKDAIQRITGLLRQSPSGVSIELCVPRTPSNSSNQPLQLRAAVASTLVAGLELARDGVLDIHQREPFGPISMAACSR